MNLMRVNYRNRIRKLEKRINNLDSAVMQSKCDNFSKKANYNLLKLSYVKDRILTHYKSNVSHNTFLSYRNSFNNFIRINGDKEISSINKTDLEEYKIRRSSEVNLVSTNIDIRNIKAMFNKLAEFELIDFSKLSGVKQFKIQNKKILAIGTVDIIKILSSVRDEQLKQIIRFTLLTASRISEILNLKIKDVDFDNKRILIFQRKSNSFKTIPMNKNLSDLLNEIGNIEGCGNGMPMSDKERYLFYSRIINDPYKKLREDTVSKQFKRILRSLNLSNDFKFHSLRHSAITELINNNIPLNIVKEIAGHKSITTTMIYSHVNSKDLKHAVNSLNY